ncbi:MAG: hypothetical protein EON57_07150 [Alphaproteobacteria bacterium]|nr:MAG: hypothetical protein EON57_07150 [Alphaproteobacteria bacterium]
MLLSFVVVSATIWTWLIVGTLRAEASFTEEWTDLFTRCRVAVELRTYPDTTGLLAAAPGEDIDANSGYSRGWAHPGGRFVLTDTERKDGGPVYRGCSVKMLNNVPIAPRRQLQLAAAFRQVELDLAAAGTHWQIAAPVAPPSVFEMFVARDANSAGCEVVAMMSMQRDGFSANAYVAERGDQCRGEALGPPGQNPI